MQPNEEEQKYKKALIAFSEAFLEKVDKHLKNQGFRSRSEYINYLARKDMERSEQVEIGIKYDAES